MYLISVTLFNDLKVLMELALLQQPVYLLCITKNFPAKVNKNSEGKWNRKKTYEKFKE